jgi:hypothetical protein
MSDFIEMYGCTRTSNLTPDTLLTVRGDVDLQRGDVHLICVRIDVKQQRSTRKLTEDSDLDSCSLRSARSPKLEARTHLPNAYSSVDLLHLARTNPPDISRTTA